MEALTKLVIPVQYTEALLEGSKKAMQPEQSLSFKQTPVKIAKVLSYLVYHLLGNETFSHK